MTQTPNITTSHLNVVAVQETGNHRIYAEFQDEWKALEFFKNLPQLLHGSGTRISFGPTCLNIGLHELKASDFISIYNYLDKEAHGLEGAGLNG